MTSQINIEIIDYDPRWPALYELEHGVVEEAFGGDALVIHHVGSTAVPGLASRPQIDICVAVEKLPDPAQYDTPLATIGYVRTGPNPTNQQVRFHKSGPPQEYNLYVVEEDSPAYMRHHLFRDYLRNHPDRVQEYENMKFRLARTATADDSYDNAKNDFIDDVLRSAAESANLPFPPLSN